VVNITANGADTYTWSTQATGSGIVDSPIGVPPSNIAVYTVWGTNQITGCVSTASTAILVNPAPSVMVFASSPSVCANSPVNLTAFGTANSYAWNNGANGPNITVSPSVTTNYMVIGTNQYGCSGNASQQITVLQLPSIQASASNNDACKGELIVLSAVGGVSYSWLDNSTNIVYQGNPINVTMNNSSTFTVTGTNAAGCSNKNTVTVSINDCVGITNIAANANGVMIYPNPNNGMFTVELSNSAVKSIQLTDLSGRVIMTRTADNGKVDMDINHLSNGIYYVKVQSNDAVQVLKVVKQ
jgi:hypothetical protein